MERIAGKVMLSMVRHIEFFTIGTHSIGMGSGGKAVAGLVNGAMFTVGLLREEMKPSACFACFYRPRPPGVAVYKSKRNKHSVSFSLSGALQCTSHH